jgi:hypothetical protein
MAADDKMVYDRYWATIVKALREDQLRALPASVAGPMRRLQEPFRGLPDDMFADESSWAAFRSHGDG